ncbi:alpha-glucosidase [Diplocloster hominis]|uniref:glycoside hydrolase family 13 protein n=1 Tax=Diplocloster hominis TaxID=3079010 RepID=UPI0031BA603E
MDNIEWWKDAVIYQIYPRSFQDSNGDGIGDLQGILRRLDYIQTLGADVIWLCPIYDSPNADNGYDIRDYYSIHADYGTMEDFDRLLEEIHLRGMRLIMDLVVNHTSDEHKWFQESRKGKDSPYRDYYIWREGKDGHEPNNWSSWFGGSAWEKDSVTGMYYLHIFHKKQPDLNWDHPSVRAEIYKMMEWWLKKGVDGFRMDVINLISKPDQMPDGINGDLSPFCINGPNVHQYLNEMNRQVTAHFDIMTVGECPGLTVETAKKYAGFDRKELNLVFQFEHTSLTDGMYGKWTNQAPYLPDLKAVFQKWQTQMRDEAWNCLFWGNHDQPRAVSKFGCDLPEYRDLSAKMLCICLYFMQGTPFIYQGEELGMTNAGFFDIGQYRDIESLNAYHSFVDSGTLDKRTMLDYLAHVSRDNARTPMQWENNAGAGFTQGTPWLRVGANWRAVNAEREFSDPDSVYHFYQKVLRLRKGNPIIQHGDFRLLLADDEDLFAYTRNYGKEGYLVLCNFSDKELSISIRESVRSELQATIGQLLIGNYSGPVNHCVLRAYESAVFTILDDSL